MLGRIPTGSAFAALPLAALLTAAAQGWCWLMWVAGAVFAVAMVWTFAPWLPFLKTRLRARRHIAKLEEFWVEGHGLLHEKLGSGDELPEWESRDEDWRNRVAEWIGGHISPVEARRFRQPTFALRSYPQGLGRESYPHGFGSAHDEALSRIDGQLPELIRLRDDLERSLR